MPKANILIVEEEQVVALDLQSSLENSGYRVVGQTGRGEEALQKAATLRPDLVLMDIGLKGDMDGTETATQIRAQLHLPVIFLTAFADEATLRRARPAEPYGYILKPFDERELASRSDQMVEFEIETPQGERRVIQTHGFRV
jgi:CheY-like chemotaxis protein